jgi:hypothetical protein
MRLPRLPAAGLLSFVSDNHTKKCGLLGLPKTELRRTFLLNGQAPSPRLDATSDFCSAFSRE